MGDKVNVLQCTSAAVLSATLRSVSTVVSLPSLYVCDLTVGSVIAYWYITHHIFEGVVLLHLRSPHLFSEGFIIVASGLRARQHAGDNISVLTLFTAKKET